MQRARDKGFIEASNDAVPEFSPSKGSERRGIPARLWNKIKKLQAETGCEVEIWSPQYMTDQKHGYKVKALGTVTYHNTAKGTLERLEWTKVIMEIEDA